MNNKELFNRIVECNLLNKIELELLLEENEKIEDILEIIYNHLELDLMIYKKLTCPLCVKELIMLKNKDSKSDNDMSEYRNLEGVLITDINVMLNENEFIDDLKYKEMVNKDINNPKLITFRLYKRFCGLYLLKIENILSFTINQYKLFLKDLLKSEKLDDFKNQIKIIKDKIQINI